MSSNNNPQCRRRALHACATSMVAIAQIACKRAEELNGPIGLVTSHLDSLAGPLVYLLVSQWLEILAFTDDRILSIEKIIEVVFPPLRRVFDKVDDLVGKVENAPSKFEDAMNKTLIVYAFKWLEFVSSALVLWQMHNKEKEIAVDRETDSDLLAKEPSSEKLEAKENENFEGLVKDKEEEEENGEREDPLLKLYELSEQTGIELGRSRLGPWPLPTIFNTWTLKSSCPNNSKAKLSDMLLQI